MASSLFRKGLPGCTPAMLAVLQMLRQAKADEWPWQPVDCDPRIPRTLLKRDWIMESPGQDGMLYAITGRGLHACAVYEAPSRYRYDGICPDCQERPKHNDLGYCLECHNRRGRESMAKKAYRYNRTGNCARCGERPRHRYPSGYTIAYCYECRREMRKAEKKRQTARLLKRLRRGEFIPCIRCGEQNRHFTANSVYDYCYACFRQQQKESKMRRSYRKAAGNYRVSKRGKIHEQ